MSRELILTAAYMALVLGAAGFAYWVACRINDAVLFLAQFLEHTERAALDANRASRLAGAAASDAEKALQVLQKHWLRVMDIDRRAVVNPPPTEPQPAVDPDTAPMKRPSTDTDTSHALITPQAITQQPDPWVTETLAEIYARHGVAPEPDPELEKKPAPRKRTGSTAAKKAAPAKAAPQRAATKVQPKTESA